MGTICRGRRAGRRPFGRHVGGRCSECQNPEVTTPFPEQPGADGSDFPRNDATSSTGGHSLHRETPVTPGSWAAGAPVQPGSAMPAADPSRTDGTGPRNRIVVIAGWVLLVLGGLVALGSLAGESVGAKIGGVLIGLAIAVIGAQMLWKFVTWKVIGPGAAVGVIVGGVIVPPADASDDAPTPLVPQVTMTVTSTKSPASSSEVPPSSAAPSSTTSSTVRSTAKATRTTTSAPRTTTTQEPVPAPRPVRPQTTTRTPAPTYTPPRTTQAPNQGSNGRTGALCRDGYSDHRTGRGACSGHGGVAQWLY